MSKTLIVEGIDLSGKTTLINNLSKELSKRYKVKIIPSILEDTDNGKIIRRVLSNTNTTEQQLKDLIQNFLLNEFLKNNLLWDYMFSGVDYIIKDRSIISSFIYQNLDKSDMRKYLQYLRYQDMDPIDTTFIYLNTSLDVIEERLANKAGNVEVYETMDKLKSSKERYENLFGLNQSEVKRINSSISETKFSIDDVIYYKVISIDDVDKNNYLDEYLIEAIV